MKKIVFTSQHTCNNFVLPVSIISSALLRLIALFIFITSFLLTGVCTNAQVNDDQKAAEYKKIINERSAKIVNTLGINDSDRYNKVLAEISNQYFSLNSIHEQQQAVIASIKGQSLDKAQTDQAIQSHQKKKAELLKQQHSAFISHLKELLTEEQVEKVKNGMTYNVLNVTYAAYLDMLLNLTDEQKQKIYNWLVEARELAMDEGSSDDKHKMFGKYKGRINNYLSSQGYDMKAEEKAWQQRIRERKEMQH